MALKEDNARMWLLHETPGSSQEAYYKWALLSKVFQLLEVLYQIPGEKVNEAIQLAESLND